MTQSSGPGLIPENWFNWLLLQCESAGIPVLPVQAYLNFLAPLVATVNPTNNSVDISLGSGGPATYTATPSTPLLPVSQRLQVNSQAGGFPIPLPAPIFPAYDIELDDTGFACSTNPIVVEGVVGGVGAPIENPDGPNAGKLAASWSMSQSGQTIRWRLVNDPASALWNSYTDISGGTFWKVTAGGIITRSPLGLISGPPIGGGNVVLPAVSQMAQLNSVGGSFGVQLPGLSAVSVDIEALDTGFAIATPGNGITLVGTGGVPIEQPFGPYVYKSSRGDFGLGNGLWPSFTMGWWVGYSEQYGPVCPNGQGLLMSLVTDATNGTFWKQR